MGTVTTWQRGRPFTRADLESMPDDGHRYELIDGCLVVSPAPSHRHQRAVLNLAVLLHVRCPSYWVIDPNTPSLTAWELHEDAYVEMAAVTGAAEFSTEGPFAASFTPAALIA